jgi:hypothetical protein
LQMCRPDTTPPKSDAKKRLCSHKNSAHLHLFDLLSEFSILLVEALSIARTELFQI